MSAVAEPALLDTIAGLVASTLKIPVDRLDVDADFDSFGMDSIIAIELMTNLSKQLKVSITPAQLTAVNSISELAGVIAGSMNQAPAAPVPKAQPVTAARPAAPTTAKASAGPIGVGAAPRRNAEVRRQPRIHGAGGLGRMLAFVRNEYGLDLYGERFTSRQALIDHLLEHHADALSHYYGPSADERTAEPAEAPAVALPTGSPGPGIAVVGMACTFADASTPEALWHNLMEQRSLIAPLRNRWGAADVDAAPRWGALIEEVDRFDPAFFGLSDSEARLCDPQERLVMQALYHALQHAGLRADKLRGTRTGLFLGYAYAEYEHHLRRNLHRIPGAPPLSSSSPIYYLANRISFLYDFKGPSEVVNASCASSALAIHRACQSLAQGECDVAICGGVSLNLFEGDYAAIARYGLLSPDGTCGVFDDAANGFTRSEGVGLLVLTRVDDAERDNRRIFAKVVATHQNNRGHASFISEIKHEAITEVIAGCYEKHGIAPNSVRYIEVHGYATKWGDSFEFEGIKNAFNAPTTGEKHCALGSIKGYIGHTEPASGVASAMKVALSLYHKQFPATITKKKLNSFIDIESSAHPLYIADRPLPFDTLRRGDEPIRAGVNSFSDSGVNVHLLFEEYRSGPGVARTEHSGRQLFVFSARTRESLQESLSLARESLQESLAFYSSRLHAHEPAPALEDLAYTMQLATVPMEHRLAILATSHKELIEALARATKLLAANKPADGNGPIFIGGLQERDNARVFDVIKSQIGEEKLLENLRKGLLKDIALLWVGGIDMPWDRHWRDVVQTRRRNAQALPQLVDIPSYPFAKNRYWLDFDNDDAPPRVEIPTVSRPQKAKGEHDSGDAPVVAREWRFVDTLADGEHAEALDAEEKITRFLAQETARLLRMPAADVDASLSFPQLGFDSVGMASLIQKIIGLIGENISPSVVFNYPDIERLGRHLTENYRAKIDRVHVLGAADKPAAAAKSAAAPLAKPARTAPVKTDLEIWFESRDSVAEDLLVSMQTKASGAPVFAVPGSDGSVLSLQTLSRAMAGVRPMFGFQGVGLDGKREPLDSIQAMAEANIAAFAGLQDCGKLSLLGYSNGAVVAFEMAHQLLKQNVAVERLVLVDGRCPASTVRDLTDEIAKVFGNLITAFNGKWPLDADAFRKIPEERRADYLFEIIQRNGIWMSQDNFKIAYRLSIASERACRSYRPKKLPKACETVVVRATRNNGDLPPSLGWDKFLAKPAVCIDVDADHLSVVGKDGSAVIARIFQ